MEIDDVVAHPTYKPGLDMLEFDFDNINDTLDSDDESVVNLGRKRKASSPKKGGKKQSKHDDSGP